VRRSRAVDALRGVAVLLVLLHHLDLGPLLRSPALAPVRILHEAGFLGVSLFLVLSGFSIHLRVASGGAFAVRPFLVRRFLRLQPTYYAALGLAAVVALVSALAGHPWPHPRWGTTEIPVVLLVASHATVVLATLIPAGWLSITWSLALEEQLYLAYAALVGRLRRVPPARWLAVALAACLAYRLGAELLLPSVPKSFPAGAGQSSWAATLAFQQVPARIAEWLTGALVAEWYAGRQRLPRAVTGALTGPLLAAGALWTVRELLEHRAGWLSPAGHRFALTDVLFDPAAGLAFGLLLVTCLAAERRGRLLAERPGHLGHLAAGRRGGGAPGPLVWLGERSYSFYLVHAPIVGTTFGIAAGAVATAPGRIPTALLAVGLSGGAAALLFRWVEAPCTAWSQRAGRSVRRPPEPGLAGPDDGLTPLGHLQLGEDRGDVVGDGLRRQEQPLADLRVGEPGRDAVEDQPLPVGELRER
jgi:peptidoglycan/LPS O-acetylase OafA/YrhL